MEKWRAVPGFESTYEVSDAGRVRRLAGYVRSLRSTSGFRRVRARVLSQAIVRGYNVVGLCHQGKMKSLKVHLLVMSAFRGQKPAGHDVNHRNGSKSNNRLENLEYVTRAANNQHAYDVCGKRARMPRGEAHHMAKLTEADVLRIRALRQNGALLREIGAQFGVCIQTVANVTRGHRWRHVE